MSLTGDEPALSGKRVLVIEDVVENLRLFRAILNLEDAQVFEAEAAEAGIAIARLACCDWAARPAAFQSSS